MNNQRNSIVLSIVSGKGGVGKTVISLSLASELAKAGNKVVLIDFDFYNRGLSELVKRFGQLTDTIIDPKIILKHSNSMDSKSWQVVDICQGIQSIYIPSLDPSVIKELTSRTDQEIRQRLDHLVQKIISITGAKIVLLDCHGGPDVISYAASAISEHVIVVSIPDTMTFHGTTRFVKGLKNEIESFPNKPKIHLLFNIVNRGIRRTMLTKWYHEIFKEYFDDEEFLSLIPFNQNFMIATSSDLFPTQRYFYSNIAEKIRVIVYNLFRDTEIKVSKEAQFVSKVLAPFIKANQSLLSIVLNLKIPVLATFVILSAVYLFSFFEDIISQNFKNLPFPNFEISSYFAFSIGNAIAVGFLWIFSVFITSSIIYHDASIPHEISNRNWDEIVKAIYRIICVLLGSIVLASSIITAIKFGTFEEFQMKIKI